MQHSSSPLRSKTSLAILHVSFISNSGIFLVNGQFFGKIFGGLKKVSENSQIFQTSALKSSFDAR